MNVGGGAAARVLFHDGSGNRITELSSSAINANGQSISFPGGLKLNVNSALQVDVTGGPCDVFATWAVGPTGI